MLIITLSIYRKWRAEQEIEGLLWRINPEYLEGYHAMQSYPSKQSLASGRSADSCFMNGREDGRYKGARVRIKLIHFGKKIQAGPSMMWFIYAIMMPWQHVYVIFGSYLESTVFSTVAACVKSFQF